MPANDWKPSIGHDSHGRLSRPTIAIANSLKFVLASGDGPPAVFGARISANVAVDLIAPSAAASASVFVRQTAVELNFVQSTTRLGSKKTRSRRRRLPSG